MTLGARLAVTLSLSISACCISAHAGELVKVSSRDGVTESVFLDSPAATPPWVVMLFAGNDGAVGATDNGPTRMQGNFLIRTASYWTGLGDAAAIFDAPSDYASGMNDVFRLSDSAYRDVAAAVDELRQRYPKAKIALVGTSRGTVTVGNVLRRNPALADAYVLTSPVTTVKGGQAGLAGLSWDPGHARVLFLSNEHDGCGASPFGAARHMANSNGFDFVAVSSSEGGGDKRSECGAKSPHGFLGIEQQVLGTINNWFNGQPVSAQ